VIARGFARLGLPLVFLLATACGGGDDDDPLQPLAPPPVNPNLTVIDQGAFNLEAPANSVGEITPASVAARAGSSTPCERLIFLFSWRSEGRKSIEFTSRTPQQGNVKVGEGTEGVASVDGCVVLGANNLNDSRVNIEVRYVLAETR
jgi:hypothetical protein